MKKLHKVPLFLLHCYTPRPVMLARIFPSAVAFRRSHKVDALDIWDRVEQHTGCFSDWDNTTG